MVVREALDAVVLVSLEAGISKQIPGPYLYPLHILGYSFACNGLRRSFSKEMEYRKGTENNPESVCNSL
jgi:hypothetical protein